MTNEEKAIEFYRTRYLTGEERKKMHERRVGFVQGAEWKDRQFKEYLEKKKEKLVRLQDDVSNQREFDLIDYRISLIDEIINELFKED